MSILASQQLTEQYSSAVHLLWLVLTSKVMVSIAWMFAWTMWQKIWNDVVLSDIHHLSTSRPIKSLRTSLPAELRLAPHTHT